MNIVHMGFKLVFIDEDKLAVFTRMPVFLTVVTLKSFVSVEGLSALVTMKTCLGFLHLKDVLRVLVFFSPVCISELQVTKLAWKSMGLIPVNIELSLEK